MANEIFKREDWMLNESEEDIAEARANLELIQSHIKQIKPRELKMNPLDNEITIKGATRISWKIKPAPFKILSRVLFGGNVDAAILDTPFKFDINHKVDGSTELFFHAEGRLRNFEDPQRGDGINIRFGATLRF